MDNIWGIRPLKYIYFIVQHHWTVPQNYAVLIRNIFVFACCSIRHNAFWLSTTSIWVCWTELDVQFSQRKSSYISFNIHISYYLLYYIVALCLSMCLHWHIMTQPICIHCIYSFCSCKRREWTKDYNTIVES